MGCRRFEVTSVIIWRQTDTTERTHAAPLTLVPATSALVTTADARHQCHGWQLFHVTRLLGAFIDVCRVLLPFAARALLLDLPRLLWWLRLLLSRALVGLAPTFPTCLAVLFSLLNGCAALLAYAGACILGAICAAPRIVWVPLSPLVATRAIALRRHCFVRVQEGEVQVGWRYKDRLMRAVRT